MHQAMQALFTERGNPQHCCRSDMHRQVRPVSDLAAQLQRQIAEYRGLLFDAELQDDLPEPFRGKLETMHQTLKAAERIQGELVEAVRHAADIMGQIDRVWDDAQRETLAYEEARAREARGEPPVRVAP